MTLGELLTECKKIRHNTYVRVFVGCTTLYKGTLNVISVQDWVKLSPYFNCNVSSKGMIRDTFVITL